MSIGQPSPERIRIDVDTDLEDRIDAVLSTRTRLSRSRIAALIKSGAVEVNGERVRKSYRPRAGDTIDVAIPPSPAVELLPEDIPIDIVYEDEHLVVVDDRHPRDVEPLHQVHRLPDRPVRPELDRVGDDAVLRALHPVHLVGLVLDRHVAVDDPDPALAGDRGCCADRFPSALRRAKG